ncbi:MAG: ATP-binding cassette domain-containing protein [Sphingomonadaceae bacterium]|nr:ATP-binding cassette domain-containing protein [Sphingomonadaceae bacterium]
MQAVPFTIRADMDLGRRITPYLLDNGADVEVREGDVPDNLANTTTEGVAFAINDQQMLLKIPDNVAFLIEGGERITYQRNGASDREVSLFLLGSAWGALCYQRDLLPLHASGIIKAGRVHAFTGPSGAGKSTLAAALAAAGHMFFTDDILIIDHEASDGKAICYAGQKDLKLWDDALNLTGAEKIDRVRDDESFQKFTAVPASEGAVTSGILSTLSILRNDHMRNDRNTAVIESISGAEAIKQLRNSIYRPKFAQAFWGREKLFRILAKLIATVDIHMFDRTLDRKKFEDSLAIVDDWIRQQEKADAGGA